MKIRGACPTLFAPMPSGDGWLVRLRPRRAMLAAAEAREIAAAALRHGSGRIGLTGRGNLQLRGLSAASSAAFADDMVRAGLAEAPDRPDLLASPLAGEDPAVHPRTNAIVASLEAAALSGLPDKFLITVDGDGRGGFPEADIALGAGDGGWVVRIGGAALGAGCDADPAGAVLRLARAFGELGGARRMRDLVRACGSDRLFRAAGLTADIPAIALPSADPVGFRGYRAGLGAFGLGVAFGQLDSAALDDLAGLAEAFGDGMIRFHPSRSILIAGVAPDQAAALRAAGRAAGRGFITDPDDPRRRLVACPGAPGCASATIATREAATAMSVAMPGGTQTIHVSGCAKGCAHPGPAAITLVGEDGRYGILRNGRAGDPPEHRGLTLTEAVRMLAGA